ncbi:8772_t:CDS:2 [Cetraspora pellucida]|uniref:8772_t:CDS:1 n=1 Tax=Cetraspora pellucida TaxID=1433469 RepID=A0A9N9E6Q1_9GLOM|nr:8772_t:CDS:2 [Cetraspora pellucida]
MPKKTITENILSVMSKAYKIESKPAASSSTSDPKFTGSKFEKILECP